MPSARFIAGAMAEVAKIEAEGYLAPRYWLVRIFAALAISFDMAAVALLIARPKEQFIGLGLFGTCIVLLAAAISFHQIPQLKRFRKVSGLVVAERN